MQERVTALFRKLELNGKTYYQCDFVVPEFIPNERFDSLDNRLNSNKEKFYITGTEEQLTQLGVKPHTIFYENKGLHVVSDKDELTAVSSKFEEISTKEIKEEKKDITEIKTPDDLVNAYVDKIFDETRCHKGPIREIIQTIVFNRDLNNSKIPARDKYLMHDNIILFGPMGCGKSIILESLKNNLQIPTFDLELSDDVEINRQMVVEAILNSKKEFNGNAVIIADIDFGKFQQEFEGDGFYPLKELMNSANLIYSPYLKKPVNMRELTFISNVNVANNMLEIGDLDKYFIHTSGCTKAVEIKKLSMFQTKKILSESAYSKLKFCEKEAKKYNREFKVDNKVISLMIKYCELFHGNLMMIDAAIMECFKLQLHGRYKKIVIGEEALEILKGIIASENRTLIEDAPENEYDDEAEEELELDEDEDMVEKVTNEITKTIRAQDKQVKRIVKIVLKNMQYANDPSVKDPEKRKKNILIRGESGTGKTEIIRRLAKNINVPIFIADATQYTEEGYVGDSVNNMLLDLLHNADDNLERAERGILVIDEIDKKANGGDRSDVARGAVLNSLLKIIEGTVKKITYEKTLPNGMPVKERIDFDTSRLTVICLGAFERLEEFRDERVKKGSKPKSMGFMSESDIKAKKEEVPVNPNFINEDYEAFGMGNQFINRLENKVYLNKLKKEHLIDIMKNSDLSATALKKEDFRRDGIDLEYTEDFYDRLGELAVSKKSGARGISEALEDVFELLGLNDINTRLYSKIILNGKCIDDPNELVMEDRFKAKQKVK